MTEYELVSSLPSSGSHVVEVLKDTGGVAQTRDGTGGGTFPTRSRPLSFDRAHARLDVLPSHCPTWRAHATLAAAAPQCSRSPCLPGSFGYGLYPSVHMTLVHMDRAHTRGTQRRRRFGNWDHGGLRLRAQVRKQSASRPRGHRAGTRKRQMTPRSLNRYRVWKQEGRGAKPLMPCPH